jgi:hypothetical protein
MPPRYSITDLLPGLRKAEESQETKQYKELKGRGVNSDAIADLDWEPFGGAEKSRISGASLIEAITSGTLTVVFNRRGTYEYDAVPAPTFFSFMLASSTGRFFNDRIRGKFSYRRVG